MIGDTHKLLTWVPAAGKLPGHVSPLTLVVSPEMPPEKQGKHLGCTGCLGLATANLCARIKAATDDVCQEQEVILRPKLEIH